MSIVGTPENYLSNIDSKSDMRKLCTYSMEPSSILFNGSIRKMQNIFHCDQKKCLMLESYIPVINTSIFLKKHNENISSENSQ